MKIICVGRNYVEHAKELNNDVPDSPMFFMKPDSAILRKNFPFVIPSFSKEIHFETEVVIKIDRVGKMIQPQFAHRYFSDIALGIDFTARDVQQELKEKRFPWEIAKAFDGSAFVSDFFPKEKFDLDNLSFKLDRNEVNVQTGNTKEMIFNINTLIAECSKYFTLKKGDLIYTGTPAGVAKINSKDKLEGYLDNEKVFEVNVL
ncbi:2-keto-4-pentenoate hydratase/2-oxohepta-3-ene-1,7-dioic acid hydratase (catechol pathway) [Chishuiella changwenlii]|uniref:2-hydroxyhepta-2,4-diene-1,7-dioate isomerase n=1 Tax=Chishuiella changwenlii TaxID=1434701 RepID=A0A1M6XFH7_9FLAO|nr:fumarylacetoacetate hydrolase family protein [Chishuiella changwenlii]GGF00676.1 2-hydroxyhepta-2,4-diene-1,7-dioate isomerase [Chishuiella changwenlii]SHL04681.1 2-keto-4-pentenoate hydratase/2-oxohepta-3-ene-1,7-dioic acid hydratase (catechol pathway) [Chishuiella changwenlii]